MCVVELTRTSHLLANLVIQSSRQQPTDPKHIDCGAQSSVAEAVFALAEATRSVVHGNFNQLIAGRFDQRGNETVHPLEWKQRIHALASHGFESAAGVTHAVLCVATAHSIRNSAGQPLHHRVLALETIAAGKIGPSFNFLEKSWNIRGIVL